MLIIVLAEVVAYLLQQEVPINYRFFQFDFSGLVAAILNPESTGQRFDMCIEVRFEEEWD